MIVLDTNYLLRYLMEDDEAMAQEAAELIGARMCRLLPEVLAEAVYVLAGYYEVPRGEVAEVLEALIELETIAMGEKELYLQALRLYGRSRLDYVDCCLCAMSSRYEVATFDKKLKSCIVAQQR